MNIVSNLNIALRELEKHTVASNFSLSAEAELPTGFADTTNLAKFVVASNREMGHAIADLFGAGKTLVGAMGSGAIGRFKHLYAKIDQDLYNLRIREPLAEAKQKLDKKINEVVEDRERDRKMIKTDTMEAKQMEKTLAKMMRDMGERPSISQLRNALEYGKKMEMLYATVRITASEIAYADKELVENRKVFGKMTKEQKKKHNAVERAEKQIESSNTHMATSVNQIKESAKGIFGALGKSASDNINKAFQNMRTVFTRFSPQNIEQGAYIVNNARQIVPQF